MPWCSYNFIKFSMCIYNFNVAFRISTNRWNFGLPVQHSEIYGLLDTLPGVVSVKTVTLDAKGKGVRRNRNGDLLLPVNGLVYLKDWECMISSAE